MQHARDESTKGGDDAKGEVGSRQRAAGVEGPGTQPRVYGACVTWGPRWCLVGALVAAVDCGAQSGGEIGRASHSLQSV